MQKDGIERKLSTATDQTLGQYLRAFVNYRQDDWSELIHYAELAMRNAANSSSKRSPFEINYGFYPNFDFLEFHKSSVVPTVDIFMNKLRGIWIETIKNLKNAETIMKKNSDHLFRAGQYGLLDTENLKRNRPSGKLDFKRIGPFEIIEKIN